MEQINVDDITTRNILNMGPMLVDNSEGKPLPRKFKYIDHNYIRSNIRKQFRSKHLLLSCVCQYRYKYVEKANGGKVEEACNEECLNRQIYIECVNCEWGSYCTNRNFSKGCLYTLQLFYAGNKGWGVKTLDFIKKDSFVIEYNGEVISQDEFLNRSIKYEALQHKHFYTMALSKNYVIDATSKGNISRFINHSCDPNLMTQLWSVNGFHRMGFFAIKDIQPGTELSFDYNFIRFNSKPQKCYCNSKNCSGEIGKSIMSDDILLIDDNYKLNGLENKIVNTKSCNKITLNHNKSPKAITENSCDLILSCGSNDNNLVECVEDDKSYSNSTISQIDHTTSCHDDSSIINNENHNDNTILISSHIDEDETLKKINSFVHGEINFESDSTIQTFLHLMLRSTLLCHKIVLMDCLLKNHTEKSLVDLIRMKILVIMETWSNDHGPLLNISHNICDQFKFLKKFVHILSLFKIPYRNTINECKLENKLKEWNNELSNTKLTNNDDNFIQDCNEISQKISFILDYWNKLELKFKIPKKDASKTYDKPSDEMSYNPAAKRRKQFHHSAPKFYRQHRLHYISSNTNNSYNNNPSYHVDSLYFSTNSNKNYPPNKIKFTNMMDQNNQYLTKQYPDNLPSVEHFTNNQSSTYITNNTIRDDNCLQNSNSNHNTMNHSNINTGYNSHNNLIECVNSQPIMNDKNNNCNLTKENITILSKNNHHHHNTRPHIPLSNTNSDQIFYEKFNRSYTIPNWNGNIHENKIFKDQLAALVVSHLNQYYNYGDHNMNNNPNIKIHSKIEFKYLAKKLTHMIITKQLKLALKNIPQLSHNTSNHTITLTMDEQLKRRAIEFLKEFMSNYTK